MQIKETDDEKTKARKKKLQKSFKSKQRFQEMDKQTQKKQQSWLDFKSGKGSKKKVRPPITAGPGCLYMMCIGRQQGGRIKPFCQYPQGIHW